MPMIFDDDFFENLPSDKYEIGMKICGAIIYYFSSAPQKTKGHPARYYQEYLEAFGALTAYIESYDLEYAIPILEQGSRENENIIMKFCFSLNDHLGKMLSEQRITNYVDKYKSKFPDSFNYKFTDGDLNRIQSLVNNLRNLITDSELFDAKHKERLLSKLESLQKELHKKMSSLDKFWGLIGEAGVALGKFGQDAKPFVDIIKEIAQIIWRTQATAEELPSGTRLTLLKSDDN